MKVLDLFCGCGGLSLGFEKAGYSIIGAFDSWKPAIQTYNANMDHEATLFDLSDVPGFLKTFKNQKADVVIGGPPCQDFSSAGRREEKDRANLTLSYAQIVAKIKPRFFVMENVARSKDSKTYKDARAVFVRAGYGLTEIVIDSSYCGVPQIRKRFFSIGALNAENGFMETLIKEALSSKRMTVRDYMGKELDISHYYRHPRNYNRRAIFSIDEPSATIRGVNRPIPEGYKGHHRDTLGINEDLRPLTTAERSRIQTFPKSYKWVGSRTDVEQMIGNAVPVNLAKFVAERLSAYAESAKSRKKVA